MKTNLGIPIRGQPKQIVTNPHGQPNRLAVRLDAGANRDVACAHRRFEGEGYIARPASIDGQPTGASVDGDDSRAGRGRSNHRGR